jgi:hypothetical protein
VCQIRQQFSGQVINTCKSLWGGISLQAEVDFAPCMLAVALDVGEPRTPRRQLHPQGGGNLSLNERVYQATHD